MQAQLEQFYRENYDTLVKVTNRRAGGITNAEDVVQEAFTRALTHLHTFNPNLSQFSTWFDRIRRRALFDFKRDELKLGMTSDLMEADEPTIDMGELQLATLQEIAREIEDHAHSEVLRLHYIFGYQNAAITEITDINKSTVDSIIRRFKVDMGIKYGNPSTTA